MHILEFIEKSISEFTIQRIAVIFTVLIVSVLAVVSYELTTSHFKLDKYAKAAAILKNLDSLTASNNKNIRSTADAMAADIQSVFLETKASDPALSETQHRIALSLVMGLPWLVISVVGIVEAFRREPDWEYGLVGCIFLALLFGSASYFVPPNLHWFYRYLVIPLLAYSMLCAVFYAVGDDDSDAKA